MPLKDMVRSARAILPIVLLGLVTVGGVSIRAQEGSVPEPRVSDEQAARALEELAREGAAAARSAPPMAPGPLSLEAMDPETREAMLARYRRYEQHQIALLEHRERVLSWQLTANQISFWVVLSLVATGVAFAGIQFRQSLKTMPKEGEKAGEEKAAAEPVHELSLSTKGLTIRSSVIGLIILALSLGFFYLYLVYVFPLVELGQDGAANDRPAAESTPAAGD